jgi:hypothetical protein
VQKAILSFSTRNLSDRVSASCIEMGATEVTMIGSKAVFLETVSTVENHCQIGHVTFLQSHGRLGLIIRQSNFCKM